MPNLKHFIQFDTKNDIKVLEGNEAYLYLNFTLSFPSFNVGFIIMVQTALFLNFKHCISTKMDNFN